MELETQKVSKFKSKKFWLKTIGVIVLISIIYGIGSSGSKVQLEEKKVDYDELVKEIKSKEKEIKTVQGKLDDIKSEYSGMEKEFNEALEIMKNKDKIQQEINDLNKEIDGRKNEIVTLDGKIDSKNKELASVSGKVKEAKGKPIILDSGQYIVGKDVPEGRYKATNIGRGSNFFVYDSSGMAVVNTILGNDGIGSGDYVFFTNEGNIIETHAQVKLIPVE